MSPTQIGGPSKHAAQRAVLREPVIVSKFFCNRRCEVVVVSLREFEGIALADVRKHYTAADGKLRPTAKGIAVKISKLPELAAAIGKALAKAKELGLIPPAVQS
jgi:hypothetical protein